MGFHFGPFGGEPMAYNMWKETLGADLGKFDPQNVYLSAAAFMDDTYLIASSLGEAQTMINELMQAFQEAGLQFASGISKFMSENCGEGVLWAGDVVVPRVSETKVLGSIITSETDERRCYEHRIAAAWACYWRWAHILECEAQISI